MKMVGNSKTKKIIDKGDKGILIRSTFEIYIVDSTKKLVTTP